MINYYLFSFGKINWTIKVSKELGINISNVDENDRKFIFHHLNWSLNILWDNYIKNENQLLWLIKLVFIDKEYDELMTKGKEINDKRNKIYKEEKGSDIRRKKDEKLYLEWKKNWDRLLEINDIKKNYLNTLLMCCWLNDFLIDLWNFTTYQKIKFDNDLSFQNTFKPLLEQGVEYSNWRQYLKYLEFDNFKEQLINVWNTIDITIWFCHNRQKFLDDIIHIWWLIQIYLLSNIDKIKFTSLIAIIEYLLVREVNMSKQCKKEEDWITKQFTEKTYEIIKKYNFWIDIDKNDLKKIYWIRSDIVHGDIIKMKEIESWLYKMKIIIYVVLNDWIKDPQYFDVLKNIKKMKND